MSWTGRVHWATQKGDDWPHAVLQATTKKAYSKAVHQPWRGNITCQRTGTHATFRLDRVGESTLRLGVDGVTTCVLHALCNVAEAAKRSTARGQAARGEGAIVTGLPRP
jgi:hypothetical protein